MVGTTERLEVGINRHAIVWEGSEDNRGVHGVTALRLIVSWVSAILWTIQMTAAGRYDFHAHLRAWFLYMYQETKISEKEFARGRCLAISMTMFFDMDMGDLRQDEMR